MSKLSEDIIVLEFFSCSLYCLCFFQGPILFVLFWLWSLLSWKFLLNHWWSLSNYSGFSTNLCIFSHLHIFSSLKDLPLDSWIFSRRTCLLCFWILLHVLWLNFPHSAHSVTTASSTFYLPKVCSGFLLLLTVFWFPLSLWVNSYVVILVEFWETMKIFIYIIYI